MPRADPDRANIFKMKITTMRRPDGKNQYKITIPKELVERVRKDGEVLVGGINMDKNHVYIQINKYLKISKEK
jgi:DNA polymerase III sliding clamp (beta) subunit (PCNA family)